MQVSLNVMSRHIRRTLCPPCPEVNPLMLNPNFTSLTSLPQHSPQQIAVPVVTADWQSAPTPHEATTGQKPLASRYRFLPASALIEILQCNLPTTPGAPPYLP
jgi:hypothetical protein